MPQVIDRMKAFAKQSKPPFEVLQFDPNQAVAKGAAIFGHRLSLEQAIKIRVGVQTGQNPDQVDLANVSPTVKEAAERDVAAEEGMALPGLRKLVRPKITNVTAKSFGVVVIVDPQTRHEGVSNLVKIDDQVPRKISRQYPTSDEGQTAVDLRVMQNDQRTDRVELSLCDPIDPIGTAVIEFGRPLPQGSMIEVTFELAQDGRLSLHGRDLTTGNEIQANFETKGAIMSKEEVAEARSRALAMNVS
jgi:molecular chaperone DnaK (HSP70)